MGADTKIEWARHTFNPWIGCTKVAAACDHCYAEARMDHRLKAVEWGPHGERKRTTPAYWRQPIAWNRAAIAAGERPFVFCASLADVFDNQVPAEWRADLFELIRATPQLVWLLLTKRPGNIMKMVDAAGGLPRNVALGTSCGDQADADRNVPMLLEAAGWLSPAFTFVSAEPLLGSIRFSWTSEDGKHCRDWLTGDIGQMFPDGPDFDRGPKLDWIIVGGESGPNARPMHPAWVREIRNDCASAGTAFFFKQWGEWIAGDVFSEGKSGGLARHQDGNAHGGKPTHWWSGDCWGGVISTRVGKAAAGRLLDGVTHDAMPRPAA